MLWVPGKEAPRSGRLHGGGEAQDGALMGGWEFSGRTIKELPASLSSGCPGGWVALSPGPTPHLHLGSSSLAECMNCTRLSDMSERLITLEAKVRQTGEPGPGELACGEDASGTCRVWLGNPSLREPSRPEQPGPRGWALPGPRQVRVAFCRLGHLLGWGQGVERAGNLKVPGGRLVWVQASGAEGLDAQKWTPQRKEWLSRQPRPMGCYP